MPRLNPSLSEAVFFLYEMTPKGLCGPVATGVFMGTLGEGVMHYYAITSQHTAPRGASVIRVNTKDGKSRHIELGPEEWQFIPGGADVSAVDVTDLFEDRDVVSAIPMNWHGTAKFIADTKLGPGEEAFMLGLFADHHGGERNIVAARFGNLSMLATEAAPIQQPNGAVLPSHIFDMRSRGGFSGSPVFVYRTPDGDLRNVSYGRRRRTSLAPRLSGGSRIHEREGQELEWEFEQDVEDNIFVALLGIHAGQYPEPVEVKKVTPSRQDAGQINDGDQLEIPGGMTIVVPLWEVHTLLNLEFFVDQRGARADAIAAKRGRTAKGESAGKGAEAPAEPVADNPSHKEDFMSLLGAAAKANKSAS